MHPDDLVLDSIIFAKTLFPDEVPCVDPEGRKEAVAAAQVKGEEGLGGDGKGEGALGGFEQISQPGKAGGSPS